MDNMYLLTDESLISLYQEGNDAAIEMLLSRYRKDLRHYILFYIKIEDVVPDIIQDIYVKVLDEIRSGRYEELGHYKSWLIRIAHNCIVDYCRHQKNLQKANESEEREMLNDLRFSEETIEDKIIYLQIFKNLRYILRFLPKHQREVVWLRVYKELSFKEIAGLTGVSINTALGRMRYAVLNMRKIVKKNETDFVLS